MVILMCSFDSKRANFPSVLSSACIETDGTFCFSNGETEVGMVSAQGLLTRAGVG